LLLPILSSNTQKFLCHSCDASVICPQNVITVINQAISVILTQDDVCVHLSLLVLIVINASLVPGDMSLARGARYDNTDITCPVTECCG
jgi:hypothetical protein